MSRKRLVVNADDFGFTPDVNEGILEAHEHGILTATTLMANGAAFDHAVELARRAPSLDIGCHLVLVGGQSVLNPQESLPRSVAALLARMAARRIRIQEELAAQVGKILKAGIVATHIDTHKHTHLAPPVLEAVARVAEEFGIGWVRRPLGRFSWLHGTLERHNCRMTDHFAGFQWTGRLKTEQLLELIRTLPDGVTELMCHPGRCREQLQRAQTRLKESREWELEALMAPQAGQMLRDRRIELVNYRALAAPTSTKDCRC